MTAALQRGAALRLQKGDRTLCGWTLIAVVPCDPWPWCLVERGNALGRLSPRMFLAGRGEP